MGSKSIEEFLSKRRARVKVSKKLVKLANSLFSAISFNLFTSLLLFFCIKLEVTKKSKRQIPRQWSS